MASSPRINTQLERQTLELRRKARLPVHRPSACSGVKALRNTSDARRQAAKLCYRFGPLTPSARSGDLIAGDGTKNGLSRSEQKTLSTTQNNRLTGKAPYKSAANLTSEGVAGQHNAIIELTTKRPVLVDSTISLGWVGSSLTASPLAVS